MTPTFGFNLRPLTGRSVTDVWLVAGDEALHRGFHAALDAKGQELGWTIDRVRLPINMVLHTGVALSQILFCIDVAISNTKTNPKLHCVVSEAKLKQWPKLSTGSQKSRLDNVNHCLRSFGVDGASTRELERIDDMERSGEFLLRSSLKNFVILGDGPVGVISVDTFRRRLTWLEKRVLSNENFLEELVYAGRFSPLSARNGMTLMLQKGGEIEKMFDTIACESGLGRNVLLVVLDPSGRSLM